MQRAVTFVAIILSCLVAARPTAAEIKRPAFFDGNKLGRACSDQETPVDAGVCFGYIFGAMDFAESVAVANGQRNWCFPDDMSSSEVMNQSAAAVQLYLRDHPEDREWTGAALLSAALKEKFPCKPAAP
jgi:hypothetical protein